MKQPCDCCAGIEIVTPEPEANRPGLDAIAYRIGTHASFLETMLARLSNLYLDIPSADGSGATSRIYPLKDLTTRDPADPAIALLDAWATVVDVLTFYQERIANEGYLRTATERRSVLELARLVGYRLRPGVASSVYLAFTVANGFKGDLTIGTRAQSLPDGSDKPQFFETSEILSVHDVWNRLKPSLARPQVFTPPALSNGIPSVTGADVVDSVYLDGIATNLKTGDSLLFSFGASTEPVLRKIESVDAQADQKRTQAILAQSLPSPADLAAIQAYLQLAIDKATYLFPGSAIARDVTLVLSALIENSKQLGTTANLAAGAIAQIQEKQDIALKRGFKRVAAWTGHILQFLRALSLSGFNANPTDTGAAIQLKVVPTALQSSPLANLAAAIGPLSLAPSLQPANSQRLARTVAQSFSPQSDTAPRLLAALKPAVADTLYQAWAHIEAPPRRVEVQAVRLKATFFASGYPGSATITQIFTPAQGNVAGAATPASTTSTTTFIPPTLPLAWKPLVLNDKDPLPTVPLDATYEQIKQGSWAVIDRPVSDLNGTSTGRIVTYHKVVGVRATSMDTGTGFTAKVTLVDLDPPWLSDASAAEKKGLLNPTTRSTSVLRGTVIYAQTEPLELTSEPLDTDVEKDSISLDGIFDGIEPGRWIIVSGNRTDIPNVSKVTASELAMVAAVAQGLQEPYSAEFPAGFVPFFKSFYTTSANAFGDRLVVGEVTDPALAVIRNLPPPDRANQKYREQIQLAPGEYANAYVPTQAEINGAFPDFEGLLVDPDNGVPFPRGNIETVIKESKLFAWRISAGQVQTLLTLAQPLAYQYDTATVTVYGNVVKATQGQTVGELLGNGDATAAFQKFALHQAPLTYVSAPTSAGASSTLSVRVNEVDWQEEDNLNRSGPTDHAYITQTNDDGQTSVIFGNGGNGARLPTGNANVKAVYRYGMGKAGNVKAWQISQLATHPAGAQDVINPLPASGGADPDSRDQARRNAPLAVMALDRLVSVKDYADFARTYAGISKASATRITDGRRQWLHLTIAGVDDIPIDQNSDLYRNVIQSLRNYGDPFQAIQVCARRIKLLVISAGVRIAPGYHLEDVAPKIQAALLDTFSFERRNLSQNAFQSEAISVIQGTEGVVYADLKVFDSVPEDITVEKLAALGDTLKLRPYVEAGLARLGSDDSGPCQRILAAELVFISPDIPTTLILTEISG